MPKAKVYIETTIPSYLMAWPSRDLVKAAHQQITQEWWQERARYALFVSQAVRREAGGGDPAAAARRLQAIKGIPVLELNEKAKVLAQALIQEGPLPEKAAVDALHIAVAAINGMDYLLTWNCTHLANAPMRNKVELFCRSEGYTIPIICTPQELVE